MNIWNRTMKLMRDYAKKWVIRRWIDEDTDLTASAEIVSKPVCCKMLTFKDPFFDWSLWLHFVMKLFEEFLLDGKDRFAGSWVVKRLKLEEDRNPSLEVGNIINLQKK